MKTNELLSKLKENIGKSLLFEYAKNKFAGKNYHLTEVKNVHFSTVDCGGNPNEWKEMHIQLWESPKELDKTDYLKVDKAISILERVDTINPLWLETEVKVEFGNDTFHTSILEITEFVENKNQLIVKLFVVKTACKAPSNTTFKNKTNVADCCGSK